MFKKIVSEAYARIVLSYKSTLVGLGAGIAVIAIDAAVGQISVLPDGWAKVLAGVLVAIGALIRSKALPPANP